MKRLFEDEMDQLTDAESLQTLKLLATESTKPRRTVTETLRPWAVGATALGVVGLAFIQTREKSDWGQVQMMKGPGMGSRAEHLTGFPAADAAVGATPNTPSAAGVPLKAIPPSPRVPFRVMTPEDLKRSIALRNHELAEIEVDGTGTRESASTKARTRKENLESLPVETFNEAVGLKAGVLSQSGELHFRGGRSGEVAYMIDGIPVTDPLAGGQAPAGMGSTSSSKKEAPSVAVPEPGKAPLPRESLHPGSSRQESGTIRAFSTGGTAPVNGESADAMFFESEGVNPFVDTAEDSLATFAVDVDNASFTMTRAYLEQGALPPPDAVRVEEFVNAIRHDYAPPVLSTPTFFTGNTNPVPDDFRIHLAAAPSPYGQGLVLLRVGLKAREVSKADRKPCTLTFVIDVSGSMELGTRLGLVKEALHLLLDQMTARDRVGIVVYGTDARVVLPPTSLDRRLEIEHAIDLLQPEGSTNAQAGLREGYRMAEGALEKGRVNRIILCSDGVANNGVTEADGILDDVRSEAARGIELTTVGFGMGNYNDVLMEKLADHGDGNYWYVDDLKEARRVFVETLTGTLQTIARQMKSQVEFNPQLVERYRLLGYENRDVADRDFRNDAVDAGEVGAGHEVTALFEIKLRNLVAITPDVHVAGDAPFATVRIRYESVDGGGVRERAEPITRSRIAAADRIPADLLWDASVAEFAEILRHSYWAKESSLDRVVLTAEGSVERLGAREDRTECLSMMRKAADLWRATHAPNPR